MRGDARAWAQGPVKKRRTSDKRDRGEEGGGRGCVSGHAREPSGCHFGNRSPSTVHTHIRMYKCTTEESQDEAQETNREAERTRKGGGGGVTLFLSGPCFIDK